MSFSVLSSFLSRFNATNKNDLPALPCIDTFPDFIELSRILNEGIQIELIYIDTAGVHKSAQNLIASLVTTAITQKDILALQRLSPCSYILYIQCFSSTHDTGLLMQNLFKAMKSSGLNVGCACMLPNSHLKVEEQLFSSLNYAIENALRSMDKEQDRMLAELKQMLAAKSLRILYQPLVSLHSGQIFGYEALSRGPAETPLANPVKMFSFAESANLLYPLDKLSREKAVEGMADFLPHQKLFLNISPDIISDPAFKAGRTLKLLEILNLTPKNVVFEITERTSIKDFTKFRRLLEHYRDQGFMVAVDDAGAGYSSLQSIAELHPDFIKIDMSLIKDVDKNPVKKALIETFVTFAQKINSELIAEGIETPEEFQALIKMGIHYGQGYFLARPNNPPPPVTPQAREIFARQFISCKNLSSPHHPIKELLCEIECMKPSIPASDAIAYFNANKYAAAIVVRNFDQPLGLIMRDKLFNKFAHPYGPALYWKKPVAAIMDANPLVVEANLPINIVAGLAMNRPSTKLYDYVIVTENKNFLGVVSIQNLFNTVKETI